MKHEEETKKPSNGFGLRLAFAIILPIAGVLSGTLIIRFLEMLFHGMRGSNLIFLLFVIIIGTVLQFIAAFAGRKKSWANILSIILGILFIWVLLLGILAIVGGVRGDKPFRAERQARKAAKAAEEARIKKETVDGGGAPALTEDGLYKVEIHEKAEFIRPKMSLKGKKAIMIMLIVSYSLLLIAGILLSAIPSAGNIISGMGICEETNGRAYAITIGVMWCMLVPTVMLYFATISPYGLSKAKKIIIFSVSCTLTVAMIAVFFVIMNAVKINGVPVKRFYEGSDSWFVPLSAVFAPIAMIICHVLTLFKINPVKIKTKKPQMPEGNKILGMVAYVFKLLIYGILCLVKGILKAKEKQPDVFILIATILLTWLAYFASFIFAIICIAVLLGVVIMYFTGVMSLASGYSDSYITANEVASQNKIFTYTDSNGYEQAVYSSDNKNFYDAGGRYVASSSDGGRTITFAVHNSEDTEQ